MNKPKYKIIQDWYYTSYGCDCCEADRWEIYYVQQDDFLLGEEDSYGFHPFSFNDKEQALEFILKREGIEVEFEDTEDIEG